jgi:hypothetical protein
VLKLPLACLEKREKRQGQPGRALSPQQQDAALSYASVPPIPEKRTESTEQGYLWFLRHSHKLNCWLVPRNDLGDWRVLFEVVRRHFRMIWSPLLISLMINKSFCSPSCRAAAATAFTSRKNVWNLCRRSSFLVTDLLTWTGEGPWLSTLSTPYR